MRLYLKAFVAAAAVAALASCTDDVCNLQGKIENIDGLENPIVIIGETRTTSDTVQVVEGAFTYSCPIDASKMLTAMFLCDNQPREKRYIVRFVPDAKKVNMIMAEEPSVTGSPLSEVYYDVLKKANDAEDYDAYFEINRQAYLDNCQNVLGERFWQSISRELTLAEFDEYLAMGTDAIKNDPRNEKIRKDMVAAEATAVGCQYVDFKGVTPEGKDVSLSDFIGKSKLTLVDFWASWCGPCMRSMPAMVELWNEWHTKGLNIVGVAVWDGDNSASRQRITEKGMVWPQIFVGEDKSCTDTYGILGIPHVIILDAEGQILYRDVPDEEVIKNLVADRLGR